MKKLLTSYVSTGVGQPIKSGSLEHIQNAYTEAIEATVKGIIGDGYDATKYYVLNGLVNTGTYPNYNVTAGAIFYNGEIFLVDAFALSVTSPNVAVGTITTSFVSAPTYDPVEFTDGVDRNVHQVKTIVFGEDTSGSGNVDFEDLIYFMNGAKHFVGETGEPAFLHSWANYASNVALYFQKVGSNIILSGRIGSGAFTGNGSIIFTLPAEYRPQRVVVIPIAMDYINTNGFYGVAVLAIAPSTGNVSTIVDYNFLTAAKAVSSAYPTLNIYAQISLL
jgi:hypothetical protein